MRTQITRPAVTCDGCEYIIPNNQRTIELSIRDEFFDFHDDGEGHAERHDCFRYWAHDPHIMRRSLQNRGWDQANIDEFMSLVLYRSERYGDTAGVARPPRDPGRKTT